MTRETILGLRMILVTIGFFAMLSGVCLSCGVNSGLMVGGGIMFFLNLIELYR